LTPLFPLCYNAWQSQQIVEAFFCPPYFIITPAAFEGGYFFVWRYPEALISHGTVMMTGLPD